MKRSVAIGLVALFVVLVGLAWLLSHHGNQAPAAGETKAAAGEAEEQIARVKTVPLREGAIEKTILVYGNVVPAPGGQTAISVPFESRVGRIMVSEGQEVSRGDPLLELGPSPDTHMKFLQAKSASDAAAEGLKNVQRKFELKLATNDQLLQARQGVEQAEVTLNSMKSQGVDGPRVLKAPADGLVSKVAVDEGALVAAGGPLMQLVQRNLVEIKLGVPPEDIERVREGTPVALTPLMEQATAVVGKVRGISHSINASTRLVDVFVTVPSASGFLLGQFVSGRITIGSFTGIIAPRSAVLPEEGKFVLFLAKNGKGVKKEVSLLGENGREAVIGGAGVMPGDRAVSVGNYELKDNMRITEEKTP